MNLENELLQIKHELETLIYNPRPLKQFVIRDPKTIMLDISKERLELYKSEINHFLIKSELKIELHPEKSRIIPLHNWWLEIIRTHWRFLFPVYFILGKVFLSLEYVFEQLFFIAWQFGQYS